MITAENCDIFISSFKSEFTNPENLQNSIYKVISPFPFENKSNLEKIEFKSKYDNTIYNDFTHLFWLANECPLKEYVGFCHYRRYFDFLDNIDKIKDYDTVLVKADDSLNNVLSYSLYHNIEDLQKFIMYYTKLFEKKKYMIDILDSWCNTGIDFSNNMFILKSTQFKEIFSTIEIIIKGFIEYNKLHTMEEIIDYIILNKEKYIKNNYPNNTIWYQSRIYGYLMERMVSMFLQHYVKIGGFGNIYYSDKIISETKYNKNY